eukprot:TRINITY_DN12996_c0_g1_i1.p2 TRINITY_DN12996_c0_g1~~TRINITY_DN12996_c0_g1_i1.p2  ORF type:complete len:100 (+),score=3.05 TRINITY_DN12996_c0_g1_i1:52-351(+)
MVDGSPPCHSCYSPTLLFSLVLLLLLYPFGHWWDAAASAVGLSMVVPTPMKSKAAYSVAMVVGANACCITACQIACLPPHGCIGSHRLRPNCTQQNEKD